MRHFAVRVSWDDIKERLNPLEFRRAHGLSSEAFDDVLGRIRPLITDEAGGHGGARNGTVVPAEIKLHLTLRWLRGGQFHDFLTPFGISKAQCYVVFWRVCKAICATHKLPMASVVAAARRGDTSALRRWATGFSAFTLGIISSCFGAIDGVQVLIKKPSVNEVPNRNPAQYFNRYGKPTINVQAVADHTARITYLAVNAPGGMHDNQALNISNLADVLASVFAVLGFHLVGDEAYVNGIGMLCPVSGPAPGSPEDHFNYFQSLTRQPIERAFGIIERRWGILWRRLECKLEHVGLVLLTIVLLHNICMDYAVPHEDLEEVSPACRLVRTSDGQSHQGRRFDLEQSDRRDEITQQLKDRGLQRHAVDGPRRPESSRGRGRGGGGGRGGGRNM